VRIVWKHQPLPFHNDAPLAHHASIAADEQGKFWEFHDLIFANQRQLTRDQYVQYARQLNLDLKKFEDWMDNKKGQPQIEADQAEAASLGATGTPAFFINGRYLSGAKPFPEFAKVINAELQRLKLPVPAAAAQAGG
jgi:protein-disulfide isomerase